MGRTQRHTQALEVIDVQRNFIQNLGFEFVNEHTNLILQVLSVTKQCQKSNDDLIAQFIKATSTYLGTVTIQRNLQDTFEQFEYVGERGSDEFTFYKFISQETYDSYISEGKFQLGSLKYYREIEQDESRDEKEGFSNLILDLEDRQILCSVLSGLNHWILCGSKNLEQTDYMMSKFGGVILKINDVSSFAENLANAIGAASWSVGDIFYSDFKAIRKKIDSINLSGVHPDNLSVEFFNLAYSLSELPSIFAKPLRFKPENELRLSFRTNESVDGTINFQSKELLDHIEIIK